MVFTALHRALGVEAQPFTYELLEQVVAEQVEEQTQLDWKAAGPLPANAPEEAQLELVKDLAAMANSGGGVIVYGLREKRGGRAEADELVGVPQELDEAQEKRLRQLGWATIHPPLHVTWHPVVGASGTHLIVAEVPDSAARPHMVNRKGDGGYFGVPWRDGPQSRWMDEAAIAAAYARRFEQERRHLQDMQDRADAFTRSLTRDHDSVWVSAIALPHGATRPAQISVEEPATRALLTRAWGQNWKTRHPSPRDVLQRARYRYGMRRAVYEARSSHLSLPWQDEWVQRARAEIHSDGTLALAYSRGGFDTGPDDVASTPPTLVSTDLEETLNGLLGLMWAVHETAGTSFDYFVRVSVHVNGRSLTVKRPAGHGDQLLELDSIEFYEDLQDVIAMNTSHAQFLTAGTALQRDAVNQLGTDQLHAAAEEAPRLGIHDPHP